MGALDSLLASAGTWRGSSRLQDPETGAPDDSPSALTVSPVLGGRFVRIDYTWGYHGAPQEGSLLIGARAKEGVITVHRIDTWHMGHAVMACEGAARADPTISVRGTYAAPPGPDWGWRIDLAAAGGETLRLVMFNVSPEGREELAVTAEYARASH